MQIIKDILAFIAGLFGQVVVAIVSVILLVVAGAAMIGFGAIHDMEWLVYAGMVVAALGIIPVVRVFSDVN